MKVFTLDQPEIDWLADALEDSVKNKLPLRVAFDPIDNAIKVKDSLGRWSPPLGMLETDD